MTTTDTTTSNVSDFIVVPKNEKELLKSEVILQGKDAEELLEYQDVFLKFLDKARFSYQIELAKGTYRGKENYIYNAMDIIDELKKSLISIESGFKKYKAELEAKKAKNG